MKIAFLIFFLLSVSCSLKNQSQNTFEETRKFLIEPRISKENFGKLFQNDAEIIDDLITALDDQDKNVRNNAQTMIRYIGNPKATKAMYDWLSRNALKEKEFPTNPIPVPINDWEYQFEKKSYMYLSRSNLYNGYALLIDGSEKAMATFDNFIEQENKNQYDLGQGKKLERLKELEIGKTFQENGDLANAVLQTPFFQFRTDSLSEKASAKKLKAKFGVYNLTKTKALLEVQKDDGSFEVITEKVGENLWKFYSIIRVSVF